MMNVTRSGSCEPVADLVRGAADRDEVARAEQRDRVLVGDAARRRAPARGSRRRCGARDDAHATAAPVVWTKRSSGTVSSSAGVARELEERVEAGALARAEAVAELLEVAREEAGRIAVALGRLVRELLGLGARERAPTRRARPRAPRARPRAAPGTPRRRTPSADPSARARAGRGRGAASDPRTPTAAPRRRSAASPPPRPLVRLERHLLGLGQQHLRQRDRGRATRA